MTIREVWQKTNNAVAWSFILLVRGYQYTLGRFLGGHCRYMPSCSEYFIGAVKKYGPWIGTLKGAWRILRCHPFAKGGFDPY